MHTMSVARTWASKEHTHGHQYMEVQSRAFKGVVLWERQQAKCEFKGLYASRMPGYQRDIT